MPKFGIFCKDFFDQLLSTAPIVSGQYIRNRFGDICVQGPHNVLDAILARQSGRSGPLIYSVICAAAKSVGGTKRRAGSSPRPGQSAVQSTNATVLRLWYHSRLLQITVVEDALYNCSRHSVVNRSSISSLSIAACYPRLPRRAHRSGDKIVSTQLHNCCLVRGAGGCCGTLSLTSTGPQQHLGC